MATRTRAPKQALEAVADAPPEASEAPPVQNKGVAVFRVPDDQGNEQIQIAPLGDMDPLAITPLLKKAIKVANESLGLED